ncbi:hypothetical protein [Jiulongibacter sp. NS-SX5]|uniref:hypothetical protein n=1 Tax=Jiulongibacter sp. NS-SX5 TaxID=3463854 RepID=UPI0040589714
MEATFKLSKAELSLKFLEKLKALFKEDEIEIYVKSVSKEKNLEIDEITLASQKSLEETWLNSEEDKAWSDL